MKTIETKTPEFVSLIFFLAGVSLWRFLTKITFWLIFNFRPRKNQKLPNLVRLMRRMGKQRKRSMNLLEWKTPKIEVRPEKKKWRKKNSIRNQAHLVN